MKVLYHCYGGTHSSVLAAAIHTGHCSPDRPPTRDELETLPLFDKRAGADYGRARFYGPDAQGHEVWVIGRLKYASTPDRVFGAMARLFPESGEQVVVNVTHALNWQMRFGGFVSRALHFTVLGRPFIAWGARRAYPEILALVARTKGELKALEDRLH
ncbi:MAG: DUF3189 family protein [Thermoanaerobacterales bacterium]|nr:DUF3189 family protein [Bacillota bacterium]MDI6906302.1 DUF3189 family protein [Thermoanaerobacterales bacterium]